VARFLARRLVHSAAIVLIVVTLTFLLVHLAPGDPASAQFRDRPVSPEVRAQYRRAWGLDRPLYQQYLRYLGNLARGDLGHSFALQRPVADIIAEALPKTVLLAVAALGISFAVGIVLGTAQGATPDSKFDHTLTAVTLAVFSMPIFWFGLMLMLVFGQWLGWFPVSGAVSPIHNALALLGRAADSLHHLVLPAVTLGLGGSAVVARFHRAEIAETFSQHFIRTARAKGLSERDVIVRHALRAALLPAITMFGLSLPVLFSGSVLVEHVFGWRGMGLAAFDAVARRDYNVVTAIALFGAIMVVIGNLLADLVYRMVDPRTRES
jgi:peptide/nickel transport system permease protein